MEASKEPDPARFSTLEVSHESYPEVVPQTQGGCGIKEDPAENYHGVIPVAPPPSFWKRKWVWAVVFVCVVMVGVIVGAVVGTHR